MGERNWEAGARSAGGIAIRRVIGAGWVGGRIERTAGSCEQGIDRIHRQIVTDVTAGAGGSPSRGVAQWLEVAVAPDRIAEAVIHGRVTRAAVVASHGGFDFLTGSDGPQTHREVIGLAALVGGILQEQRVEAIRLRIAAGERAGGSVSTGKSGRIVELLLAVVGIADGRQAGAGAGGQEEWIAAAGQRAHRSELEHVIDGG